MKPVNQQQTNTNYEMDLFDLIDILWKRKYLISLIFMVVVFIAVIYSLQFRPDPEVYHKIEIGVRYPGKNVIAPYQMNSSEPKFDIGDQSKIIIEGGIFNGNLKKELSLDAVPEVAVRKLGDDLSVFKLIIYHLNEEIGKRILAATIKSLRSDPLIQSILDKERNLILNNIEKHERELDILEQRTVYMDDWIKRNHKLQTESNQMLDLLMKEMQPKDNLAETVLLFKKQELQLTEAREAYHELRNRLVRDIKDKKDQIDDFKNKLDTIQNAFKTEGRIYSARVPSNRISNRKIIGISGILGLAMGILLAVILEVRIRKRSVDQSIS